MEIQEILQAMNAADHTVAAAVGQSLTAIAVAADAIVPLLQHGGRLIYVGAGTSGRLGVLDAAECPPTFGVPLEMVIGVIAGGDRALRAAIEGAEDDEAAGARDIASLATANDAVVGISACGSTPYVLSAMQEANRIGALTIGLTCSPHSLLSARVRYPIEIVTSEEIIRGSTRLKAGTAQKMALNMISTGVMICLGKTYDNLMVNVRATNGKLKKRVIRIIQAVTAADEATARAYSDQASGDARIAIIMLKFGVSAEEARRVLAETNDHFGLAMSRMNGARSHATTPGK